MSTSASSSRSQPPHNQRQMIEKFIEALREQGFLDDNFSNMRNLPDNQDSLARFCGEAEPKLETVERALDGENVDFRTVIHDVEMIRTAAARVGGKRVVIACTELQQHCSSNSVESSKDACKKLSWEYYVLRDSFHHILHAERTLEV